MKFRFIVIFLIVMPLSVLGGEIEVTIHVDDGYKPFSFTHKGDAKGIYINVLRTAFSKMTGFKVTIVPIPWNRGKRLMELGHGFGLAPAYFHGHDWPYLYPYSLPFYTETIIAVCTEMVLKQPKPYWPEDYSRLTIGNVAGFDGWGGDDFRALVKKGEIEYHEVDSSEALIRMLVKERLDCIMMENRAFDYELNVLKKSGAYNEKTHTQLIKGATIGTDHVYIGYSEPAIKAGKYLHANAFRKAFDEVIYQMTKSGEIEQIMDAYK